MRGMNACLLILAMIALPAAAPECLFHGAAPEGTATFRLAYPDGVEDWAAVRVGNEWAAGLPDIEAARGRVELYYDTPWSSREPLLELPSRLQFAYEAPAVRRERLRDGWEQAGFTFIETGAGCLPVPREELALAERARDMVAALDAAPAPDPAAGEPMAAPAAAAPAPGWLALWGPHAAVLGVGGLLLLAAVRFLLLAE
jgi:hypothetical protein